MLILCRLSDLHRGAFAPQKANEGVEPTPGCAQNYTVWRPMAYYFAVLTLWFIQMFSKLAFHFEICILMGGSFSQTGVGAISFRAPA